MPAEPVYLDHAASTPLRPEAAAALRDATAANASARHLPGQQARARVEEARERVAAALGCASGDVVFTAGATEADNLAVQGICRAADGRDGLVISGVEHPAVRETARWLAGRGEVRLTEVPPRGDGTVEAERVLAAVDERTALVSVMAANNEVGAVNDVAALAAAVAERGAVLHTDAVQALATRRVPLGNDGADALACSAHKLGGPQGVGVAVLRRGVPVDAVLHGGGQDRGVRSGTFAVALIEACAAALEAAVADRAAEHARLSALSDRLAAGATAIEGVHRNGPRDPDLRLASHVHLGLEGVDPDALTVALDRAGVAASAGSACSSGAGRASHVVEACGLVGTPLRLSLGWTSTADDVDRAVGALAEAVPASRITLDAV